jgi:hypothetical protein
MINIDKITVQIAPKLFVQKSKKLLRIQTGTHSIYLKIAALSKQKTMRKSSAKLLSNGMNLWRFPSCMKLTYPSKYTKSMSLVTTLSKSKKSCMAKLTLPKEMISIITGKFTIQTKKKLDFCQ